MQQADNTDNTGHNLDVIDNMSVIIHNSCVNNSGPRNEHRNYNLFSKISSKIHRITASWKFYYFVHVIGTIIVTTVHILLNVRAKIIVDNTIVSCSPSYSSLYNLFVIMSIVDGILSIILMCITVPVVFDKHSINIFRGCVRSILTALFIKFWIVLIFLCARRDIFTINYCSLFNLFSFNHLNY